MNIGTERFVNDLTELGYDADVITAHNGVKFVVLRSYCVPIGKFVNRIIDFAFQVGDDYPGSIPSAIHVSSQPPLFDKSDTVRGKRNIIDSVLGAEWRYWSYRFIVSDENPTKIIMGQVIGIFNRA